MRIKILGLVWALFLLVFSGVGVGGSVHADEIPIYCPETKQLLYYWDLDKVECNPYFDECRKFDILPEQFRSVEGVPNIREDDRFVCPGSEIPLNGFEYFYWKRGYNLKVVYQVYSLMTMNDKGEYVWVPYNREEIFNIMGLE